MSAGVRQDDQLSYGAGMPASVIPIANFTGPKQIVTNEAVDDGRLSDARRSEQRSGLPETEVLLQHIDVARYVARDGVHRDRARERPHLRHHCLAIGRHVGLVQDDDRRRTTFRGYEQITLDPSQVEIAVETGDEKHRVDVRGNDLLFRRIACGAPGKTAVPRQHRRNTGITGVLG